MLTESYLRLRSLVRSAAIPAAVVTLVLVVFHIIDIFYIQTFWVDDNNRYQLGLENKLHQTIIDRNILRAYVIFPLHKLLSIDPALARFAQVVVFYVPLVLSVYFLLRRFAGLPRSEALVAGLLPCLLPGQWMIPNFIDGSYTVQGLLVFNVALFVALYYQQKHSSFSVRWLLLVSLLFGASLEMMDHSVFLAPMAAFAFLLLYAVNRNFVPFAALVVIFTVLSGLKAIQAYYFPTMAASTTIDFSWETVTWRFISMAETVFPYSHWIDGSTFDYRVTTAVSLLIIGFGLVIGTNRDRMIIVFGLLWAFFSSIVFLTMTKYFSARYLHIAGFGVGLALVHAVWLIVPYLWRDRLAIPSRILGLGLLVGMMVYGGTLRAVMLHERHQSPNETHAAIVHELKLHGYPLNAQLVIIEGGRISIGGWWNYATGYIKYASGRADLHGMVGWQKFFYDPFQKHLRGWTVDQQMNGLDPEAPTFLFELKTCNETGCVFWQYDYALRYTEGSWSLMQFDRCSGAPSVIATGKGKPEFYSRIKDLDIAVDYVMFAN